MTVTKDKKEARLAWAGGAKLAPVRIPEFDLQLYVYGDDLTKHRVKLAVAEYLAVECEVWSDKRVKEDIVADQLEADQLAEEAALGGAPEPEVGE